MSARTPSRTEIYLAGVPTNGHPESGCVALLRGAQVH